MNGFEMDNLLAEGRAKQMIMVMPHGGIDTKIFGKDFISNLVPYIYSNYNVHTELYRRALIVFLWAD